MNKKLLALLVSLVLVVALVCACGQDANNTPAQGGSDQGDAAPTEFIIGGIGPLTGDAASYGISTKQGAQIAVDEINAAGGVNGMQFKLLFEDDELDEEKAINAYNKLMDQGMNALVGAVTSGCCIAVTDLSSQDGILQITPSGSAKDCTQYDNGFRICFTDPLQGETMADFLNSTGVTKIAVIYDVSDEYSNGIREAFEARVAENGGTIVASESFTSGDVDFKTQLTKIKSTDAEALFLPIYYTEAGYIASQAQAVGLSIPYYGCDGWDGIIKQLDGNTSTIEGSIFLTPFIATSEDPAVVDFVAAYQAAYNTSPDQFAADGYDAVYAIKLAIEKANSTESADLIAAMTEIQLPGLTGDMTFGADGEPTKTATLAIIQDGQYQPYTN